MESLTHTVLHKAYATYLGLLELQCTMHESVVFGEQHRV